MITYNHEKFIAQAIEGVIAQKTKFDFELIIGEDSGSDKTRAICESYAQKYPGKIKLLPSDSRYGMMRNFIRTLHFSKGKYIALCEGDDYWTDKQKLQKQVSFLEQHPDYSLCFHDVFFEVNKKKYRNYQWDAPVDSDLNYLIKKGNYLSTLTVVYRNHKDITAFLEIFPDAPLGDYLTYLAAAKHGKIRFIKERMGVYRVHAGGNWSQMSVTKSFVKYLVVLDKLYDTMGPGFENDFKIQMLDMLESVIRVNELHNLENVPEFRAILKKMGITPFMVEYLQFSTSERSKDSFYSKTVPFFVLMKALREKIKNRMARI